MFATELFASLVPANPAPGGPGGVGFFVWLALVALVVAGVWKTFEKAGEPGWAALVPIYNLYVMLKIGDNQWWWLLVLLVPLVNIYAAYRIFAGVSRAFGHGIGYALGLWLLGFVFWPLLGFGDDAYQGVGGGDSGGDSTDGLETGR